MGWISCLETLRSSGHNMNVVAIDYLGLSFFQPSVHQTLHQQLWFFYFQGGPRRNERWENPVLPKTMRESSIEKVDDLGKCCHYHAILTGEPGPTSPNRTEAGVAPTDIFTSAHAPIGASITPSLLSGVESHVKNVIYFVLPSTTKCTEAIRFHF